MRAAERALGSRRVPKKLRETFASRGRTRDAFHRWCCSHHERPITTDVLSKKSFRRCFRGLVQLPYHTLPSKKKVVTSEGGWESLLTKLSSSPKEEEAESELWSLDDNGPTESLEAGGTPAQHFHFDRLMGRWKMNHDLHHSTRTRGLTPPRGPDRLKLH